MRTDILYNINQRKNVETNISQIGSAEEVTKIFIIFDFTTVIVRDIYE